MTSFFMPFFYLPTCPNHLLYYIVLFNKITFSLTYLPTLNCDGFSFRYTQLSLCYNKLKIIRWQTSKTFVFVLTPSKVMGVQPLANNEFTLQTNNVKRISFWQLVLATYNPKFLSRILNCKLETSFDFRNLYVNLEQLGQT